MRKSDHLMLPLALGGLLCALTLADAQLGKGKALERLQRNAGLVSELELTDLSLFTEARYTRHLSQADRHSALQDHPMAIEHFPTGSLVTPPETLLPRR
jgi:hypothetical protein